MDLLKPFLDAVKKPVKALFEKLPLEAQACLLATLLVVLAPIKYPESVTQWTGITKRIFRVLVAGGRPQLSAAATETCERYTTNMCTILPATLSQENGRFAGQAWTAAQIVIALAGKYRISADRTEQYFYSQLVNPDRGWRKYRTSRYPEHVGVTSYVLLALASLNLVAHNPQIDFLLENQNRDATSARGWWPIFPLAQDQMRKEYASTFATALAVEALYEQLHQARLEYRKEDVSLAIELGNTWLYSVLDATTARAKDYPRGHEMTSVSALSLRVLHRTSNLDLTSLDRLWLKLLPPTVMDPHAFEASVKTIFDGDRPVQTDETRYYVLPELVRATIVAYPKGDWLGKAYALSWLDRTLAPYGPLEQLQGTDDDGWIAAEVLAAVRTVESALGGDGAK